MQELNNKNVNWNCLVTHILFDDNYNFYQASVIDSIAIFSTGIEKIYAPKNTIIYLGVIILKIYQISMRKNV